MQPVRDIRRRAEPPPPSPTRVAARCLPYGFAMPYAVSRRSAQPFVLDDPPVRLRHARFLNENSYTHLASVRRTEFNRRPS